MDRQQARTRTPPSHLGGCWAVGDGAKVVCTLLACSCSDVRHCAFRVYKSASWQANTRGWEAAGRLV